MFSMIAKVFSFCYHENMRIDQILAREKIPRKQIKKAIKEGEVLVDGKAVQSLGQNVDTGLQELYFKGRKITSCPHRYFILNKPAGLVTANKDKEHPTVFDCLADQDVTNLYAVGRLDRDTRGLLLITDNGPLGFQLLHPDFHVVKSYEVCVNGPLDSGAVVAFSAGIVFRDGVVCKPAELEILSCTENESWARVRLSEGKLHQVKKMFLAVGVKVTYLKRLTFGDFVLDDDLSEGDYRSLTLEEKEILKGYLEASR